MFIEKWARFVPLFFACFFRGTEIGCILIEFVSRFIEQPRHIEVQVLGDKHGNVVSFRNIPLPLTFMEGQDLDFLVNSTSPGVPSRERMLNSEKKPKGEICPRIKGGMFVEFGVILSFFLGNLRRKLRKFEGFNGDFFFPVFFYFFNNTSFLIIS